MLSLFNGKCNELSHFQAFPTLRMELSNEKVYKHLLGNLKRLKDLQLYDFLPFACSLYKKLNSKERHSGPFFLSVSEKFVV